MTFNPVSSPAISGTTTSGVVPTTTSSGDAPALNAVKNPSLTPVPEGELGIPSGDVPSITPQSNVSSGPSALNSTPAAQGPQQPAGGHPHLKDNLQEPIRKMFHDDTPQVAKGSENATQQMLEKLGDRLKPDGSFDLKGLKAADGTEITAKMLKKAHLSVKITGDDGKFDYKVSGHCNEEAAKCLEALECVLNAVDKEVNGKLPNGDLDPNHKPAFNLMANIVRGGGSTPSDANVLGRGGQIHYKLQGDDIIKLTLDPGEHGENDGLSVQCLNGDGTPKLDDDGAPILQKIPLNVVFEGAEHDGVRAFGDNGRPFLPDWRSSKIFEASQMHVQTEYWTKKEVSSNIDDINRVQAENRLWNAAYEYLKLMVNKNTSDGNIPTFDISSGGNSEQTAKGIDTPLSPPDFSQVERNSITDNTANRDLELLFNNLNITSPALKNLTYTNASGGDTKDLDDTYPASDLISAQIEEFSPVDVPNVPIPSTIETSPAVGSSEPTTPIGTVDDSKQTASSDIDSLLEKFVDARQKNITPEGGYNDENALIEQLIPFMNDPDFENQKDILLGKLQTEGRFTNRSGELRTGGAQSRKDIEDRLGEIRRTVQEAKELHTAIKNNHVTGTAMSNFRANYWNKPGYQYIVENIILKDIVGVHSQIRTDLGAKS